jgi:hypothetical protein
MEPNKTIQAVPPDAVRVWRGFRNPNLTQSEFFDKLAHVFIPVAMQMQRIYGLVAYLPAVLPADHAAGLPDEVALVFYPSQAAYRATKEYPGGRAYSDLHSIVFNLARSRSRFPEYCADEVEIGTPCYLFGNSVDWQTSPVELWVGARRPEIDFAHYAKEMTSFAREQRVSPQGATGAILCVEKDWVLYWQCGSGLIPRQCEALERVSIQQFHRAAIPLFLPPLLTDKVDQAPVHGGEFYNLQFPRVQLQEGGS